MSSGQLTLIMAAVAAALGWGLPDFNITVANYIGLYGLVALGVVLLTGVVGVTSFGQAAFVGLSAYTSAVLSTHGHISPWLSLLVAVGATAIVAAALGAITIRLSGHYLPLGTIAWGLSLYYVFGNLEILGGQTGLTGLPALSIFGFPIETGRQFFFLIWAILLAFQYLLARMLRSRVGRAMRSVRNSKDLAVSFGIYPAQMRLVAFVYAAILAAISGWLYAHMLRFLNPTPFNLTMGIEYLFMAVIGGVTNISGAIIGAGTVTILREFLQGVLPRLIGQAGNFETIVFGVLVIALLQFNGDGGLGALFGRFKIIRPRSYQRAYKVYEKPTLAQTPTGQPVLSVLSVSKSFGGLQALSNISFDVASGEILAVIGPNGAGKSTLFNVISGLLSPDAGAVCIAGQAIAKGAPQKALAAGLVRTFQHVKFVPELSVIENVMLGGNRRRVGTAVRSRIGFDPREEAELYVDAANNLTKVGLRDVADQSVGSLPLGKQRLVEIARALSADPKVLLLDEPAAGLRHLEKAALSDLLIMLRAGGLGIVLVEHDLDFVMRLANRIVVMNFGEKLVEGSPGEVSADQRVIEAYLGGALT